MNKEQKWLRSLSSRNNISNAHLRESYYSAELNEQTDSNTRNGFAYQNSYSNGEFYYVNQLERGARPPSCFDEDIDCQ